jgi:hypothetical protein
MQVDLMFTKHKTVSHFGTEFPAVSKFTGTDLYTLGYHVKNSYALQELAHSSSSKAIYLGNLS